MDPMEYADKPFNRFDGVTGSVYDPHGAVAFNDPFDGIGRDIPQAPVDESGRPFITPFNPDPPFSHYGEQLDLTLLSQTPPGGQMENRFRAGHYRASGWKLIITIPSHIPPRISHRASPWLPPRCGFPPSVRITKLDVNWTDVDIHITYEMIKEHCYSPGLFEHTFFAVFSVPGLAAKIVELDNCPAWFAASTRMCERLPPTRCMIRPVWGSGMARHLVRYLHYECAWSKLEFQKVVEPFVARRTSNFFWNNCCNPGLKVPAPPEGSPHHDWFIRPWARPNLPQFSLDQDFGHKPLVSGDTNRLGRPIVRMSQPKSERELLDRLH
jgi:hypothetical protein